MDLVAYAYRARGPASFAAAEQEVDGLGSYSAVSPQRIWVTAVGALAQVVSEAALYSSDDPLQPALHRFRWYTRRVMSVIVEVRGAEGGEDAKLLVRDQFAIYAKKGARRCL